MRKGRKEERPWVILSAACFGLSLWALLTDNKNQLDIVLGCAVVGAFSVTKGIKESEVYRSLRSWRKNT